MLSKRMIPCLLIDEERLIHIKNFDKKTSRYLGDPINTIKIFNDYEIDELVIIDFNATKKNRINFDFLKKLSDEAFFPLSYGGGIKNENDIQKLINIGYEKVIINNEFLKNNEIINILAKKVGAQSIIISLDIISENGNYYIYSHELEKKTNIELSSLLTYMRDIDFGELLLTSVNRDGTMNGCDYNLMKLVADQASVPIIYKGGASSYEDIKKSLNFNISAFSSGTIFIMKKKDGGVVINYPSSSMKDSLC